MHKDLYLIKIESSNEDRLYFLVSSNGIAKAYRKILKHYAFADTIDAFSCMQYWPYNKDEKKFTCFNRLVDAFAYVRQNID